MRVEQEFRRCDFFQPRRHLVGRLRRREAGAVGDAEDVRIDRDGRFAEGDVQHHAGSLTADTRQCLQRRTIMRHFAAVTLEQ